MEGDIFEPMIGVPNYGGIRSPKPSQLQYGIWAPMALYGNFRPVGREKNAALQKGILVGIQGTWDLFVFLSVLEFVLVELPGSSGRASMGLRQLGKLSGSLEVPTPVGIRPGMNLPSCPKVHADSPPPIRTPIFVGSDLA